MTSAVAEAKNSVEKTSREARTEITTKSATSLASIRETSAEAESVSSEATEKAKKQSEAIQRLGSEATKQFSKEAAAVKSEVNTARTQIQAASELQPQMKMMQDQLGAARDQLQAQQKMLSSSEDFVKQVFSSHTYAVFDLKTLRQDKFVVVPPPSKDIKNTVLYVLLPTAPIQGTMQLQYRIFLQPPGSYFVLHNLLVFFWGDPPDGLKQSELTASYFPDTSDNDLIHKLDYRDGRVFADGEPLLKFGQPDLDFKGSKWIKMIDPATGKPMP